MLSLQDGYLTCSALLLTTPCHVDSLSLHAQAAGGQQVQQHDEVLIIGHNPLEDGGDALLASVVVAEQPQPSEVLACHLLFLEAGHSAGVNVDFILEEGEELGLVEGG